jgi:hypothetical protein
LKRHLKYIALLLVIWFNASAINSPQIRSVLVQSNGMVQLCWELPSDPNNEFKSYEVFYSNSLGGPYSNMASISSYTTGTATCFTSNANVSQYFFYIQVKTLSNVTMPAVDTVRTIFLILNSPPLSQYAKLQWNDFSFPLPPGLSAAYKIWKEYPLGNWTLAGTVAVNNSGVLINYNHTDTISVCLDSINYRIELNDPLTGCSSVSNVRGTTFMDKNPPSPPSLDSVSVNASGQTVMGIGPAYSGDVKCFVIYQYTGGTYVARDTVCTNNLATIYTYLGSNAGNVSEEFSVAALDSCNNISQIALNPQNTIKVTVTYDICAKTANLSWNQYKNMKGGVARYEILCSVNGGPFTSLGDTIAFKYKHANLANGNTYCYIVRAHNPANTVTSTSNRFCIIPAVASMPAYVYLSGVSVLNPGESVNVKWHIDNSVKVGAFQVFHSAGAAGPWTSAGVVPGTGSSTYSFIDPYVDASARPYYFKVHVLDTCMNFLMKTDTSNTIYLSAFASGNLTATLNWTTYGDWLGGISGYNIYRTLDGAFTGTPIATVPAGTNSYVDDVSAYYDYSGRFTYYVEALEGAGNPYGLSEKSESNYANVYIDANLYVPSAFIPKGYNKIFVPVGNYLEKTDYRFSIFDRWGTKVFETTNIGEGWDGGKYEEGIYAYLIEYKTSIGEYREQKGTVMLVR